MPDWLHIAARGRRGGFRAGLALVCAATLAAGLLGLDARAKEVSEYELKAAFLLHFVRLVQWPPDALPTPDEPLRIGIFGDDPFGPILDRLVAKEIVQGRRVEVVRLREPQRAASVHLLFVPASEAGRLDALEAALGPAAVLLVGESPGFASQGGAINLYEERGRIRFEVNRAAAARRGLRLSSRLLRLARLVESAE